MKARKIVIVLLVLLLSTQNLAYAIDTTNVQTSQDTIQEEIIITTSETWSQSQTLTQDVIVAPNATLTISEGAEIQFQGNLIIYGNVRNYGKIFMNGNDVIANYINMGGIIMSGDSAYLDYGRFDPYGYTTNVDCICLIFDEENPYPAPPVEVISPSDNSTVSQSTIAIKGKTVPGFTIDIKGKRTVAAEDGTFSLNVELSPGDNILPVSVINVLNREYNVEDLHITLQEDKTPPTAPIVDAFDTTSSILTGKGEANATVTVKKATTVLGETKIASDGTFSVNIGKQAAGTVLSVTATDLAGNVSDATLVTVKDTVAPTIQSTLPVNQAKDVPVTSSIIVTFNEEVNRGPNYQNIKLVTSTSETISSEIEIESNKVIIRPTSSLQYGTQYRVEIPTGAVTDKSGNENQSAPFTFQTEEYSTKVSGGIYEDIVWKRDKSPYVVTGDIVVYPDVNIKIEPGVTVKFSSGTEMAVRGNLIAEGTSQQKITFTSKSDHSKGAWDGISIERNLGGKATFKNAVVNYANTGVTVECCGNDNELTSTTLSVESSTFENNQTGVYVTGDYGQSIISKSTFINNGTGLKGSFKKITDSIFKNNQYGVELDEMYPADVYNSTFTNNTYGIYGGATIYKSVITNNMFGLTLVNGDVKFNKIENNNTAITISGYDSTITNNSIINNDIGFDIFHPFERYTVKSNNIQNKTWNIKNHLTSNLDLKENYWGVTDESVIKQKIFDGYDDVGYGIVVYRPFLTEKASTVDTNAPTWGTESSLYAQIDYIKGMPQVHISWSEASDEMEIHNYKIYKNGSLIGTVDKNTTRYEIPNIPFGEYTFKVEAEDLEGNLTTNGPSTNLSVRDLGAPEFPNGSSLTVKNITETSLELSWPEAKDNVGVTVYRISQDGREIKSVDGNTRSYTVTGLQPNTDYQFAVIPGDAAGNWPAQGLEKTVTTLADTKKPVWPPNSKLEVINHSNQKFELKWPAAKDNVKIDYYVVKQNGVEYTHVPSNQTSLTILNPAYGTEYQFSIVAYDTTLNPSEELVSQSIKIGVKAPIVNEVSDQSIAVSGKAEVGTTIYVKAGGKEIGRGTTKSDGTFAVSISKQKAGTELYVTATNNSGIVSTATKVTVKDKTPPAAPEVNEMSDQALDVTGKAEPGALVEVRFTSGSVLASATAKSNGTFVVETPAYPNVGLKFIVTATDKAGNVSKGTTITVVENLKRVKGSTRYDTAVEISKLGWKKAETVVLARGDSFPDALAGAPLAYKLDAPILLTQQSKLTASTQKEIKRLGAKKVIVLGGTGAISDGVEKTIKGLGLQVERISGQNRYETANAIAKRVGNNQSVVVAYGSDFPDALAIASYAAQNGYPILLTSKDKIQDSTKQLVKNYGTQNVFVVGGTGVVSDKVVNSLAMKNVKRIGGKNRFETAGKIITDRKLQPDQIFIANGFGFADALTGSVLAAKYQAPLLLVRQTNVPKETIDIIQKYRLKNFKILGGTSAVTDNVINKLKEFEE
ncbi:cell wall-binding repeat-containing protein [Bacillus timonensis]|uniref:cell wall-binding repeat-containing protein n=1 Tax=Bacillus timonensis TaxID=1033734 RepID=UPI000288B81A|nr:cell wall-binding repeat-containing protein [Bacillus timonensis]